MNDADFLAYVGDRLMDLPGVQAVALGGSRVQGTHDQDSDWDLAIYYRGRFEPDSLRALGWSGVVSEIGGWGGGVFNGGAWLQIGGRRVDVHYRDLDVVDHEMAEAEHGRFHIEPLMFHLAGIPSYLVVGELAINQVLRGQLPRPKYPEALRNEAPAVWWDRASMLFDYAENNHARKGRLAQCLGLSVQAASQAAHAVLAAKGEWVTNEKALLFKAGLDDIDRVVMHADPDPDSLVAAVRDVRKICSDAVSGASYRAATLRESG